MHNIYANNIIQSQPDWKNYRDQARSCPRDWRREATIGALRAPSNPSNITQHGIEGFDVWGALNWHPLCREASGFL